MKYLCKLRICILGLLLLTSAIGSTTTAISANAQGQPMPRFALSSIELPNNLAGTYGLTHYGRDFGLDIMKDNFTYLSSHSLATQVVLSGQADIVVGAFVSQMLVRQAGQDFKTFCLRSAKSDQLLLAKGGITKLAQLLDPKVRISLDSPGGVADATLNAIFQAANINATTKSLSNVHILESAQERFAALLANDIDATILTLPMYRQLQSQIPDLTIISKLYEDVPLYVTATYAAPKEWLDSHLDEATAICAAVIKGQRALSANYDLYAEAVKELIGKPPTDAVIREEWQLIHNYDTWNLSKGVDPDAVKFMSDIMVKSGVLTAPQNPADVLDLRPYQGALKLLGPYVAPTDQATPADAGTAPAATSAATPSP